MSFLTGAIRQAATGTGVRAVMMGRVSAAAPVSMQQGEIEEAPSRSTTTE
jgi:hypothetical protein